MEQTPYGSRLLDLETTQSGEVVLFAHQNSLWDAMKSHHNEF